VHCVGNLCKTFFVDSAKFFRLLIPVALKNVPVRAGHASKLCVLKPELETEHFDGENESSIGAEAGCGF
jgi:hypothetical protein